MALINSRRLQIWLSKPTSKSQILKLTSMWTPVWKLDPIWTDLCHFWKERKSCTLSKTSMESIPWIRLWLALSWSAYSPISMSKLKCWLKLELVLEKLLLLSSKSPLRNLPRFLEHPAWSSLVRLWLPQRITGSFLELSKNKKKLHQILSKSLEVLVPTLQYFGYAIVLLVVIGYNYPTFSHNN